MITYRRPTRAAAAGDPIPYFSGGKTHLFYLSSPSGTIDYPERVRTTWQHVATADFLSWEQLAPALEPGAVGAFDGGGIWTGSVVKKDETDYLFYTGHHVGAAHPQTICLATSRDLVHFDRRSGPLIEPAAGFEPIDWRDPYVFFNEDEGLWWMLIAARLDHGPKWRRGAIALATSSDLVNWQVEAEPLYVPGTTFCPECPELWQMNGRWYLVFSRFSEEVGTIYRVADSPRGPFRVPAREDLGGRRWYAAKSAPQPDGSRVFFGWLHDFVTEGDRPRWLWGGDFAAPRVVTADPSGDLKVTLHPAVASWFAEAENDRIALAGVGGEAHSALGPVLPATARVTAEFSLPQSPAALGLALVDNPDLEGWFVTINRKRGLVSLSQEPRPLDDFWADLTGRPGAYREIDGPIVAQATIDGDRDSHRVTVLLDGEVLEVYVDDEVALTHRVGRARPLRPVAFVVDGDTEVVLGVSKPLST